MPTYFDLDPALDSAGAAMAPRAEVPAARSAAPAGGSGALPAAEAAPFGVRAAGAPHFPSVGADYPTRCPPDDPVAQKLLHLRELKDDANGLWRRATEQLDELRRQGAHAKSRRDQVLANWQRGDEGGSAWRQDPQNPETWSPEALAQQATIDRLAPRIERLQVLQEQRSANFQAAGGLEAACSEYLSRLPASAVRLHATEVVAERRRGESISDAIERLRRRGRELDADRQRVATSSLTAEEAKALAAAEIAKLVEAGRPDISGLLWHGEKIVWPMSRFATEGHDLARAVPTVAHGSVVDSLALIAAMFPKQLAALVEAEISREFQPGSALSRSDRGRLLAENRRDRLAVERVEERLIETAEADGVTIARRRDTDVRAVLALADDMPTADRQ